jgi:hypothetical protein
MQTKIAGTLSALFALVGLSISEGQPVLPRPGNDSGPVSLRATGPHAPDALTVAVANKLPSTRLEEHEYPEAGVFTARRIVQVLCGRVDGAYMAELIKRNKLTAEQLKKPLGHKVYSIDWPACLYVQNLTKQNNYTVRKGETLSGIRYRLTGVPGTEMSNARYFGIPPSDVHSTLQAGQSLTIPYVTWPTTFLGATLDAPITIERTAAKLSPTKSASTYVQAASRKSVGSIVTYVNSGAQGEAVTPQECVGVQGSPFGASEVAEAYRWERNRRDALNVPHGPVSIMVVDNGFFGVRPNPHGGSNAFGTHFPEYYFNTYEFGDALGPTFDTSTDTVYPLNFLNSGVGSPNKLSGHGTHVTGLVLGGPEWSSHEEDVFGKNSTSWVRIIEFNVGRGGADLLPGSQDALAKKIGLYATPSIVNMSISYDGSVFGIPSDFSFMNPSSPEHAETPHLYVVAAGNDSGNAFDYFPAALGGIGSDTAVITVAASGKQRTLTKFTNKGSSVDVAAPGCNIRSWIDDKDSVVELSGTSQAAPTVTFEAALIRSLIGSRALDLKARIIASGDLLASPEEAQISAPVVVNLRKALYVFDDYVRYRTKTGRENEKLGVAQLMEGVHCQGGSGAVKSNLIRAYKVRGDRTWVFYTIPGGSSLRTCVADAAQPGARFVFKANTKIEAGRYLLDTATDPIEMRQVIDFVKRGPPIRGEAQN